MENLLNQSEYKKLNELLDDQIKYLSGHSKDESLILKKAVRLTPIYLYDNEKIKRWVEEKIESSPSKTNIHLKNNNYGFSDGHTLFIDASKYSELNGTQLQPPGCGKPQL